MIRVEGVAVSFNKTEKLLSRVDLTVAPGESFVVIGPSGTGKSVLIKMLAGLIKPISGRIKIEGKDLHKISRREQAAVMQKVGMLFQKNALFDSFTVRENLAFPLRETTTKPETEIQSEVKKFLDYVGLLSSIDLFPDEISGGMQKRVGIARALILHPEIILYDDPTAGLDPITSKLIIELILKLKKELGTTVVAVTNDMNRAYQMADRIGIILDHSLMITGTVDETKKYRDERVQQFIHGRVKGPLMEVNDVP